MWIGLPWRSLKIAANSGPYPKTGLAVDRTLQRIAVLVDVVLHKLPIASDPIRLFHAGADRVQGNGGTEAAVPANSLRGFDSALDQTPLALISES